MGFLLKNKNCIEYCIAFNTHDSQHTTIRTFSYYTGYTNDLEARLIRHNKGQGAKYTRAKRLVKLVWNKEYKYLRYAMKAEYSIKQLNRNQKELLVGGMRLD